MVFHGLLVTRLDHLLLFDNVLVVWALKVFLENLFVMVLISIRTRTKFLFRKVVQRCVCGLCFGKCFERMFCNGSRLYKNVYRTFCLLKVF